MIEPAQLEALLKPGAEAAEFCTMRDDHARIDILVLTRGARVSGWVLPPGEGNALVRHEVVAWDQIAATEGRALKDAVCRVDRDLMTMAAPMLVHA